MAILPGSMLKEVVTNGKRRLHVIGNLPDIIRQARDVLPTMAEQMATQTAEVVADLYATIFAAEERLADEPLPHFHILPDTTARLAKDKSTFYEWKSPGVRKQSRVKRYSRHCEV